MSMIDPDAVYQPTVAIPLQPAYANPLLEVVPGFMTKNWFRVGGDTTGAGSIPGNWDVLPRSAGMALVANAGTRNVLKPTNQPSTPSEATLISIQSRNAASTAYTWHQMDGAGATNSHYTFSDNKFYIATFATARWVSAVAIPTGVDLSLPHVCVITAKNNDHRMWVQGVKIGSSTSAGAVTFATNFCFGRDDLSNPMPGPIYGTWVIPRFMSDAEAQMLSSSPAACFAALYGDEDYDYLDAFAAAAATGNPYHYYAQMRSAA